MEIFSDYHTHTKYSHGKGTVLENALAAKEKGLKEIAITDHGFGHIMFGMKRKKLNDLKRDIKEAEEKTGIKIYLGVEANIISTDGDIDLKKEDLPHFDIILCGIHRSFKGKNFRSFYNIAIKSVLRKIFNKDYENDNPAKSYVQKNTQTIINTLRKNKIDVLVHPNRYYRIDIIKVALACVETNTAFEINAKSCKFTRGELESLAATGVKFIINSDAHRPENVGGFSRVMNMVRETIPPEHIVNANGRTIIPKKLN